MSIQKAQLTTLRHAGDTFTVMPSSTIAAIKNPDALAMLVYLLDRPADWTVRREDLRKRFGLGRDRHDKAMRDLKELGLAWRETVRNDAGQITAWRLFVSATPKRTLSPKAAAPENHAEKPEDGKPGGWETPAARESDHLHSTELLHSTDLTDGPAEAADPGEQGPRQLRPDWMPSNQTITRAQQLGYFVADANQELAEFRDYFTQGKGKGKRRKDDGWQRSFLTWIKKSFEQQMRGTHHGQRQPTSSDLFAIDLETAFGPR